MLDIAFIRENVELVKQGMLNKGEKNTDLVDQVLAIDTEWRKATYDLDELRKANNSASKMVGQLMGQGKKEEAQVFIKQTADQKELIKQTEVLEAELLQKRNDALLYIPNVPHPSVPVGKNETENQVFATWGESIKKEWRRPHWDIISEHKWVDFDRGSKVTGAGFPFYIGAGARLQRALINFFLDQAVENGYTEMQPPYFVNEDSARGTGQIPDKEDMMYTMTRDGFFAIPTAEVPVTNFYRKEIIAEQDLPIKVAAYTPCWRREAGSYGKDVRGLNRLHQFDKVELVKFVHPETSYAELESLRNDAENLLKKLGLSYRTLLMCTGDMGFTQSKKYDLEVWSPGQERWLEVSSCSNFESFQARRMMLRYKGKEGAVQILHTINGSGLALPRVVAALLETYQQEDGRVRVPDVLKTYIGRDIL